MSNKSLFRFAGWSAILSIVFSFAMFAFVSGGRGGMFMAVSIIAAIFTAAVLYGLYVFHRPQAATLSLAMLVIGVVGLILENIAQGPETTLGMITGIVYGVAFLLVGYLGYGASRMPRWLAILAYVIGISGLLAAIGTAIGLAAFEYMFYLQFLTWIAWSIGIWRWFTSSKTVVATA